ncbi:hypothetical protein FDP41_006372 [Naegleria fowleri]|uniref:F-box domain-containing protein n=1 Tax=Naegleria fowleri TaxID=5763 RepID=A0A6A5BJY2_NAEFO|nr:uncharacterized protein FDP41_006372 [Naegleria fowleri]KAF0974340.1 hypothetical protein FDP41_006372 [Naegleria fowleri]
MEDSSGMKNQILIDINADLWVYHIFPCLRYLDFMSLRLVCKTLFNYLENEQSNRYQAFTKRVHDRTAQNYLFKIGDHVGLMHYPCPQYSTLRDYSDLYYLTCEEFEYIVWNIPDNLLKRVWDNLTKRMIYKARVDLSSYTFDREKTSSMIFFKYLGIG